MSEALEKINRVLYGLEKALVVGSMLVMAVLVFLDVVHRRYTDPQSKPVEKLASAFGVERDAAWLEGVHDVSGWFFIVVSIGLVFLAVRTAKRVPLWGEDTKEREPFSVGKALGIAVAVVVGCLVIMRVIYGAGDVDTSTCLEGYSFDCGLFPNGLIWSQPLALILTVWVGFLGASMATSAERHLKVEAVQRVLPEKVRRLAGLLAGLLTAGFCLLLLYLSIRYVGYKYDEFADTEGLGGLHDGIDVPRFVSFSVLPLAYGIMAARFVASGVRAFQGKTSTVPRELADLDLDLDLGVGDENPAPADAQGVGEASDDAPRPSEEETEEAEAVKLPEGEDL